jgi:hypothetical protein
MLILTLMLLQIISLSSHDTFFVTANKYQQQCHWKCVNSSYDTLLEDSTLLIMI